MHFIYMCSCGDTTTVEAADKIEAVKKLKALMTQNSITAHAALKHPAESIPLLEEAHAMIELGVCGADENARPYP